MSDISNFESRYGHLKCSARSAFYFLSDFRNFEQFIPAGTIKDLAIDKESCSFRIEILGTINLHISGLHEFTGIDYAGTVPQVNDFSASIELKEESLSATDARIIVRAGLNPFLKMMVNDAVTRGLESVIREMENFTGWPVVK